MPIHFYWGEDDFAIAKAVKQLQSDTIDESWSDFNFHQYPGDRQESIVEALNEVMTPPFGMGGRLVWLSETTVCQQCSTDLLSELESTLPKIPDNSHLLFTTTKKPDGRLKSSRLLKEYAKIREFALIPYWDERGIKSNIKKLAVEIGVNLSDSAIEVLKDFVGNNTRQLWNELEKLNIYQNKTTDKVIKAEDVHNLVICNTQNSLKLAEALRDRKIEIALTAIDDLLNRNEPPLKIVATLVSQFRLWITVKSCWETGEKEYSKIAKIADLRGNPNRIRYILNDVRDLTASQLINALPLLLKLEYSLKKGVEAKSSLQTFAVEICSLLN